MCFFRFEIWVTCGLGHVFFFFFRGEDDRATIIWRCYNQALGSRFLLHRRWSRRGEAICLWFEELRCRSFSVAIGCWATFRRFLDPPILGEATLHPNQPKLPIQVIIFWNQEYCSHRSPCPILTTRINFQHLCSVFKNPKFQSKKPSLSFKIECNM